MQPCPVDVISVCNADGTITPLRLQLEDEHRQLLRINIQEVVSVKEIEHVGVERGSSVPASALPDPAV